jgi:hypothetical protein
LAVPSQELIIANCQSAQSIINQVEKADAVARINRGRAYNETLNLLFAMNTRLASNKIAAPKLTELTSEFEHQLTIFRDDYDNYDDILNSAIKTNCHQRPAEFYKQLVNARDSRIKLATDVTNLSQLIDSYKTEFHNTSKEWP